MRDAWNECRLCGYSCWDCRCGKPAEQSASESPSKDMDLMGRAFLDALAARGKSEYDRGYRDGQRAGLEMAERIVREECIFATDDVDQAKNETCEDIAAKIRAARERLE